MQETWDSAEVYVVAALNCYCYLYCW